MEDDFPECAECHHRAYHGTGKIFADGKEGCLRCYTEGIVSWDEIHHPLRPLGESAPERSKTVEGGKPCEGLCDLTMGHDGPHISHLRTIPEEAKRLGRTFP